MIDRGFTVDILTKIGMRYTYNDDYPLIFPIMDNYVFMGWVSRTDNKIIAKKRKYLYNKGFSRRYTLCGRYRKGKPVVIVEGYMDMLKLMMFGIKNVVAILGWKITRYQIDKLKNAEVPYIICALDSDECGKKGYEYISKYFPTVRWQFLKGVKDCGEMDYKSFKKMRDKTNLKVMESLKKWEL